MGLIEDIERMRKTIKRHRVVISENWMVPQGQIFKIDLGEEGKMIAMHPTDALRVRFGGKLPFESRFNLGVREAELDRRRYGKKQDTYQAGSKSEA